VFGVYPRLPGSHAVAQEFHGFSDYGKSIAGPEHRGRYPPDRRERGRLRDELLDGEIFYTLREARIVIESWRRHYNAIRPVCTENLIRID
jgi:hypothetical protein